MAVQLAHFIFRASGDIRSFLAGARLWDLTFRVDRNNVFGALQFKTLSRHEKIQMEGKFYTSSFTTLLPLSREVAFYRTLSGTPLPTDTVDTYIQDINKSLRCVLF